MTTISEHGRASQMGGTVQEAREVLVLLFMILGYMVFSILPAKKPEETGEDLL